MCYLVYIITWMEWFNHFISPKETSSYMCMYKQNENELKDILKKLLQSSIALNYYETIKK